MIIYEKATCKHSKSMGLVELMAILKKKEKLTLVTGPTVVGQLLMWKRIRLNKLMLSLQKMEEYLQNYVNSFGYEMVVPTV